MNRIKGKLNQFRIFYINSLSKEDLIYIKAGLISLQNWIKGNKIIFKKELKGLCLIPSSTKIHIYLKVMLPDKIWSGYCWYPGRINPRIRWCNKQIRLINKTLKKYGPEN